MTIFWLFCISFLPLLQLIFVIFRSNKVSFLSLSHLCIYSTSKFYTSICFHNHDCPFIYRYMTPLSISCKAFPSVFACLKSILFLLYFWRMALFSIMLMLDGLFFPFSTVNIPSPGLQGFCWEIYCLRIPLHVNLSFSHIAFRIHYLWLLKVWYKDLEMMSLDCVLMGIFWASWIWMAIYFSKLWKFSAII